MSCFLLLVKKRQRSNLSVTSVSNIAPVPKSYFSHQASPSHAALFVCFIYLLLGVGVEGAEGVAGALSAYSTQMAASDHQHHPKKKKRSNPSPSVSLHTTGIKSVDSHISLFCRRPVFAYYSNVCRPSGLIFFNVSFLSWRNATLCVAAFVVASGIFLISASVSGPNLGPAIESPSFIYKDCFESYLKVVIIILFVVFIPTAVVR